MVGTTRTVMIKIRNLRKSFFNKRVLEGINLEILDGETITIIGASGCGKTVLLKHIIGLLKPDSGEIEVDGKSLFSLSQHYRESIQKKFSMVFQGSALFDFLNVKENVAFGLRMRGLKDENRITEAVKECLNMVGLEGIERLDTSELSGGMKKRVAIARAIVTQPKYILYDEPTTGLDPMTCNNINNLILGLQRRLYISSIIVTHDIVSARKVSNRIALLANGKIQGIWKPNEIKESSNRLLKEFLA